MGSGAVSILSCLHATYKAILSGLSPTVGVPGMVAVLFLADAAEFAMRMVSHNPTSHSNTFDYCVIHGRGSNDLALGAQSGRQYTHWPLAT